MQHRRPAHLYRAGSGHGSLKKIGQADQPISRPSVFHLRKIVIIIHLSYSPCLRGFAHDNTLSTNTFHLLCGSQG